MTKWPGHRCEHQFSYDNRFCNNLATKYYHIYEPDDKLVARCDSHILGVYNINILTESEYEVALILNE